MINRKSESVKLLESIQTNLNEKINHANDEVNRVLANPNAGRNKEKIKAMGYDTKETSDGRVFGIKNPKTNKWIDPSQYSREEKKKVDFKGKLDSERKNNQGRYYPEYVPKGLKTGKGRGYSQADRDDMEAQNGISKNVKDYKVAVKTRDENRRWAERNRKDIPYYEKKVKDAQKDLEFHKNYTDNLENKAKDAEEERQALMTKVREKHQKTTESENLKESITIDEIEEITQRIESAEDMDEIQQIIYTISDGVLEDEVQHMFDSCNEDDLDEVKSLVLTTLEDNAEYDESSLKESKELKESDESILKLAKKSIVNGKLPEEIEYKGKTYKQFYVTNSDNSGETSDIYYCNMENTPSGDPQESNDYFYLKVALNKTENGYKGIKEIKFAEDLTESKELKEAETPEAMQKIANKQMPEGGYRYIATHAIGPGTLPKDIKVFKTEDINGGKIAMYISRPLTSKELKQYDIKPEWIQEDSSYRRYKVSFFVDTDSMNNMEIEEKVNELLKGSGLASADETIDVERVEDLEEDANNFGKAHISKNAKVLAYQVENMGGGTMAIFGKLDDGNYFAGNEEGLIIYDADIRPLYLGEDEVDDKEIEEFSDAHLVQDINAIDDRELYDMIINQTNYDKY